MAVIADVLARLLGSIAKAVIKGGPVVCLIVPGGAPPVILGSDVGSDKSASDERFHFDKEKDIFDSKL